MIKFIHTADIHLDSPLKGLEAHDDAPVQEIRGATRRAFDNLVDLAITEAVDFILIAGDLYDGDWKDYNTGLFFAARMGRLDRAGIDVFIVSGNHDAASQITKTIPLPDNVTVFPFGKPRSVIRDDLGVIIHGQSYSRRVVTENLARNYPRNNPDYLNIGVLHTSLTGRDGHEPYAPCSPDELASKGYDYWALGHVHQREIVSMAPWIVFPGNLQGRHIRETGAKGATLVTVVEGRITAVDPRELDVLRWADCVVDLSLCETLDEVHDSVRKGIEHERDRIDGKPLAMRLELIGNCPIHAQLLDRSVQLTEEFRGIAVGFGDVWLETVKFRTHRRVQLEDCLGEDTPLSGLLQSIRHLDLDGETLVGLVPELSALKSKLPAEIHGSGEPFLDPSPEKMAELRSEVKDLLMAKLLQHGEGG